MPFLDQVSCKASVFLILRLSIYFFLSDPDPPNPPQPSALRSPASSRVPWPGLWAASHCVLSGPLLIHQSPRHPGFTRPWEPEGQVLMPQHGWGGCRWQPWVPWHLEVGRTQNTPPQWPVVSAHTSCWFQLGRWSTGVWGFSQSRL